MTQFQEAPARMLRFRVCCQAFDEHRFDCSDASVRREQRGKGPVLPVRQPDPVRAISRCIRFERARFGGAIATILTRVVIVDFHFGPEP